MKRTTTKTTTAPARPVASPVAAKVLDLARRVTELQGEWLAMEDQHKEVEYPDNDKGNPPGMHLAAARMKLWEIAERVATSAIVSGGKGDA